MSEQEKIELLAEAFDCEPEDLSAEKTLEELDVLNSMSALSLIVMMDDEFGKELTREQIKAFNTIGDILAFMD